MKNAFLLSSLILLSSQAFATEKTYSTDAVELLGIVSKCPVEFAEISKLGRASIATATEEPDLSVTHVTFVNGGFAPSFHTYAIGSLDITATFVPRVGPPIADGPGGRMDYQCKVNLVR